MMLKNMVELDRSQMIVWALRAGYLRLQTHTFGIYNTYCCSAATMVA
jgi:hypothetical protein